MGGQGWWGFRGWESIHLLSTSLRSNNKDFTEAECLYSFSVGASAEKLTGKSINLL